MRNARIRPFRPEDQAAVIALILAIQQDEFGIPITAADQPDLRNIPTFYQSGAGDFLVAEIDGQIVGTIGLKDIGGHHGALRKMFVAQAFRGRDHGIATSLLDALLENAMQKGVRTIVLGTTDRFLAAHRFYEKAGFMPVEAADLPIAFPRMAVDTVFYRLELRPS